MLFETRIKTHHIGKSMMKYVRGKQNIVDALDTSGNENQVIYIHVPYCSNICSFCNMNMSLSKPHPNYADMVIEHIRLYSQTRRFKESTFDSIYFGGGTPSVLSEEDLVRILNELSKHAKFTSDIEISMETSLSDLGVDKLQAVNKAGVNRISVGIQTFSDRGRKVLGRRGNGEFAENEIKRLQDTGFKNINIDLIYNYFDETLDELQNDLDTIKRLDISGFSFYSLIIMDESRLGKNIEKFNVDDSVSRDFNAYKYIVDNMGNYEFLELTKLVQPNRDEYKYIRRRLEGKDTFPIGAGAGGQIGTSMFMNPIDIDQYSQQVNEFSTVAGMKLSDEYFKIKNSLDTLQTLYYDPKSLNNNDINRYFDELVSKGYSYFKDEKYYLNADGAFWGNNIIAKLWELIEK